MAVSTAATSTAYPNPPPQIAYTYDLADRLTAITSVSGSTTSFGIDALGRHASQSVTGSPTQTYSYLGAGNTVVSISANGVITRSAIDAVGSRVATGSGSAYGYLLADLHGNTAGAIDSSCTAITDAFAYDAYGNTVASVTSSLPTPWRFQGRILESATGTPDLYDFGARSYAPGLGAFTSLDSLHGSAQNPALLNGYLYANANPATLVDPDGHLAKCRYGDDCPRVQPTNSSAASGGSVFPDGTHWCGNTSSKPKDATWTTTGLTPYHPDVSGHLAHYKDLQAAQAALNAKLASDKAKADEYQSRLNTLNLANALNFVVLAFEIGSYLPSDGSDGEELGETWDDIAASQAADEAAIRELPELAQDVAAEGSQLQELDQTLAQFGARGDDFMAGTTRGFKEGSTELDTANYLAETQGAQVDAIPASTVQGQRTPDAMVRISGDDVGTATEFTNVGNAANTVANRLGDKSSQLGNSVYGTGNVVLDGRESGLTYEAAQQGWNAFLRYGPGHIQQATFILGDGSAVTLP